MVLFRFSSGTFFYNIESTNMKLKIGPFVSKNASGGIFGTFFVLLMVLFEFSIIFIWS